MKKSRSLLAILLIATAMLVGAWFLFDGGEQRSAAHGTVEVASPASNPAAATLSEARATDEDAEAADRSISVEGEVTREAKRTPAEEADARYKVRGRVVDQDEQPVKTPFRIFCTSLESSTSDSSEIFENTQGEFVVELPRAGDWFFHAAAEGYREESVASTVSVPQLATSQVELQVFGFPRIEGLVVDPSGQPMANAKVKCRPEALLSDPLRTGPSVYSDQDGRFAIKVVQAGAGTIQATHEDWAASEAIEVELVPTRTLSGLVIALRIGGTIQGEAFERDGSPSRQNVVELNPWDRTMPSHKTTTDDDGLFTFKNVTPGQYAVGMEYAIELPSTPEEEKWGILAWINRAASAMVEVEEDETCQVALGVLPASPVLVHGCVTQGGKPVRDMLLFVAAGVFAPHAIEAAALHEDGTYELTLNKPGEHQFIFMNEADEPACEFVRVIPEAARVELNFSLPAGAIEGRVLDQNGEPVEDMRVVLSRADGYFSLRSWVDDIHQETDKLGRFQFQGLKQGEYSLSANTGQYLEEAEFHSASVTRTGLVIKRDQELDGVELKLSAGGDITGTAVNSKGVPLQGVAIFVRDGHGQLLSNRKLKTTNHSGQFNLRRLPLGEIRVTARQGRLVTSISVRTIVSQQATAEITLVLKPGTVLQITGKGAQNFRLSVRDTAGNEHANMLNEHSVEQVMTQGFSYHERSIGPLAPGEYTIVGKMKDGREVKRVIRLNGEPERALELRFR